MLCYRPVSQNSDNYVTLEILGKNLYFTRSAIDIVNSPELISKFSPEEAMMIGFIAGAPSRVRF